MWLKTTGIESHTSGHSVEGPSGILCPPLFVLFACFLRSLFRVLRRRVEPCTSLMCFANVRWKFEREMK